MALTNIAKGSLAWATSFEVTIDEKDNKTIIINGPWLAVDGTDTTKWNATSGSTDTDNPESITIFLEKAYFVTRIELSLDQSGLGDKAIHRTFTVEGGDHSYPSSLKKLCGFDRKMADNTYYHEDIYGDGRWCRFVRVVAGPCTESWVGIREVRIWSDTTAHPPRA